MRWWFVFLDRLQVFDCVRCFLFLFVNDCFKDFELFVNFGDDLLFKRFYIEHNRLHFSALFDAVSDLAQNLFKLLNLFATRFF